MSRRSNNNVRGPTSALTEFLRESGITTTLISRRAQQQDGQESIAAGPSNRESATPARDREENGDVDSDHLDDDDDDEQEHKPPKKRKLSKNEEKQKAKSKKKKNEDSDYEDSDDDEYTALSKGAAINRATRASAAAAQPPVGSFEVCANCGKQFTVTRYTMAAMPGPGWLCHICAKASGADPFKKAIAPRKRKAPEERQRTTNFEFNEFPSLASICIKVVSEHIDDVEALGDIGWEKKTEIGRVLARNRSLTVHNASLLYDVRNTELKIYDATKLGPSAFRTLASFNPLLESLYIDFCGRIDDSAIIHWAEHLPELKQLELLGPFLVKPEGWKTLFSRCPQLTGFLIKQSPRFDLECMSALAQYCTDMSELRLCQIGQMCDEFLGYIEGFKNLTSLDLSEPSKSLSTEAMTHLLKEIGANLTYLNLSKNELLSDKLLSEGLTPTVRVLTTLKLEELPEISDAAVGSFFKETVNSPIQYISFGRNHKLADETLVGILNHSGPALVELDINSMKGASNEALLEIGKQAKCLKKVDVGFCRQADNFVIKSILDGCEDIETISVFGCNKITENCPRKYGVSIIGVETHSV